MMVSMRLPKATSTVAKVRGMPARWPESNGDQPLLDQAPDFGQLVGVAKPFHPGDDDARSQPDGEQGSREQQADGALGGSAQVRERRRAAGGKDSAHGVGNLPQVDLGAVRAASEAPTTNRPGKKVRIDE